MEIRPDLAGVLAHLHDPSVSVKRAGLALLARLQPTDAVQAVPTVIGLPVSEYGNHNSLHFDEVRSALADLGHGAIAALFAHVSNDTKEPQLALALSALQHSLPLPDRYERKRKAAPIDPSCITEPDVARLVAALKHPWSERVRLAACRLLGNPTVARFAGGAAPVLCMWLTDHSQNGNWYRSAAATLKNIGGPAVDPLVRAVREPEAVIRDANFPDIPEPIVLLVRDRAAEVLGTMGTAAAAAVPTLLELFPRVAQRSKYVFSTAIVETAAGDASILHRVLELMTSDDAALHASLLRYFTSIGSLGVSGLLPLLKTKRAIDVLKHLLKLCKEDPGAVTPALPELEMFLELAADERCFRAAYIFGALGKQALTLAAGVHAKLVALADRLRGKENGALDVALVLLIIDSIVNDRPGHMHEIAEQITWKESRE